MKNFAIAKDKLKSVFGLEQFRPLQEKIIINVLSKNDSLVIMPTGGGKSICYQLPGVIFEGLTLVISPLISLMQDQVLYLNSIGINAIYLNSSLSKKDYKSKLNELAKSNVKFLYISPESLTLKKVLDVLTKINVDCITVDEAHCVSEWGHDFRPDYRQISNLRELFPCAAWIALTATATNKVRKDIIDCLGLQNAKSFVYSFNRDNLLLKVYPKKNALDQIISILEQKQNEAGIIYCFARKQVTKIAKALTDLGYRAKAYHAGMEDEDRRVNQNLFKNGEVQIIVATIAFGMGIDKSDVRFVIHHDLPKSIESYYQEIGRAGRDGDVSECILLYDYIDARKLKYIFTDKNEEESKSAVEHLSNVTRFAESKECRRKYLLKYFDEEFEQENCGMCDNCLKTENTIIDLTDEAKLFLNTVRDIGSSIPANHVISVLRGSKRKEIVSKEHHKLPYFGAGKKVAENQWLGLAVKLIEEQYVAAENIDSIMSVSKEKAERIFNNSKKIEIVVDSEFTPSNTLNVNLSDFNAQLYNQLLMLRSQLAMRDNILPSKIIPEKSLMEIAQYFPQDKDSFLKINGIDANIFDSYGAKFLNKVTNYCQENSIKSKIVRSKHNIEFDMSLPEHIRIGDAFNRGSSPEEITSNLHISIDEFYDNLYKYINEGNKLKHIEFYTKTIKNNSLVDRAMSLFFEYGHYSLKTIHSKIGEKLSISELKLVRLFYINNKLNRR